MYYEGEENREITEQVAAVENGIPYFYVYNYKGGGFLVLSAEYNDVPILANSLEGNFSLKGEISPGLGYWMIETRNRIDTIRKNTTIENKVYKQIWSDLVNLKVKNQYKRTDFIKTPSPKLNTRCDEAYQNCYWDDYCSTASWTTSAKGPLLSTQWGQSCGYNDLCPDFSGNHPSLCNRAPTGCVATALAQIIRYNQWPTTNNSISSNYALMPNTLTPFVSNQSPEIAKLMDECGRAVEMNYGSSSSGAQTSRIEGVLESVGYSTDAWYRNYNTSEVMANINYNHPVILDGYTDESCFLWWCWGSDGGHAWVSDGVNMTSHPCFNGWFYLHMNWGWNGSANGWFYADRVNTVNGNFQYQRKMLINIYHL